MARPRVFVAGPLTDSGTLDEQAVMRNVAAACAASARLIEAGCAPLCPHLSWYMEQIAGRRFTHAEWMEVCLAWLRSSQAVLRLEGQSKGAEIEVAEAIEAGIPVFANAGAIRRYFGMEKPP